MSEATPPHSSLPLPGITSSTLSSLPSSPETPPLLTEDEPRLDTPTGNARTTTQTRTEGLRQEQGDRKQTAVRNEEDYMRQDKQTIATSPSSLPPERSTFFSTRLSRPPERSTSLSTPPSLRPRPLSASSCPSTKTVGHPPKPRRSQCALPTIQPPTTATKTRPRPVTHLSTSTFNSASETSFTSRTTSISSKTSSSMTVPTLATSYSSSSAAESVPGRNSQPRRSRSARSIFSALRKTFGFGSSRRNTALWSNQKFVNCNCCNSSCGLCSSSLFFDGPEASYRQNLPSSRKRSHVRYRQRHPNSSVTSLGTISSFHSSTSDRSPYDSCIESAPPTGPRALAQFSSISSFSYCAKAIRPELHKCTGENEMVQHAATESMSPLPTNSSHSFAEPTGLPSTQPPDPSMIQVNHIPDLAGGTLSRLRWWVFEDWEAEAEVSLPSCSKEIRFAGGEGEQIKRQRTREFERDSMHGVYCSQLSDTPETYGETYSVTQPSELENFNVRNTRADSGSEEIAVTDPNILGDHRMSPRGSSNLPKLGVIVDTSGLSEMEKKRQEVIFELIVTERDYSRDLKMVIERYLTPIRTQNLLSSCAIQAIFSNIETLLRINEKLVESLERRRRDSRGVITNLADIFIEMADDFKMYTIYCINHSKALAYLRSLAPSTTSITTPSLSSISTELRRSSSSDGTFNASGGSQLPPIPIPSAPSTLPTSLGADSPSKTNFAAFLHTTAALPSMRNLALQAYLLLPVQRLCRYPLLLKEALKYTTTENRREGESPEYDCERKQMEKAVEMMIHLVDGVNDQKRFVEEIRKAVEVRDTIKSVKSFSACDQTGIYLHHGPLYGVHMPTKAGATSSSTISSTSASVRSQFAKASPTPCSAILFNDCLVLTKPRSMVGMIRMRKKRFRKQIEIAPIGRTPGTDGDGKKLMIRKVLSLSLWAVRDVPDTEYVQHAFELYRFVPKRPPVSLGPHSSKENVPDRGTSSTLSNPTQIPMTNPDGSSSYLYHRNSQCDSTTPRRSRYQSIVLMTPSAAEKTVWMEQIKAAMLIIPHF